MRRSVRMNADHNESSTQVCREQEMEWQMVYRKWLNLLGLRHVSEPLILACDLWKYRGSDLLKKVCSIGYLSGDLVLNLLDKYTSAYISDLWRYCTKIEH